MPRIYVYNWGSFSTWLFLLLVAPNRGYSRNTPEFEISHPTVGMQQKTLGTSHAELDISSET